jgi:energy-coupling factor transporter transmembrane protein EcfT
MTVWEHRDPRAKVAAGLALAAGVLLAPLGWVWVVLPPAAGLAATALDQRGLLRLARAVLVLWALTIVFNALFGRGERFGPESLGWFRPSADGFRAGVAQGARLASLAAVSAWMVAVTRALDLTASLEWWTRGRPRIRGWIHAAFLPVVLGMRLVPILADEAARLLAVERLRRRGARPGVRRLAGIVPVWIMSVLDRADALALAMTLRGYRPGAPRGFSRGYAWTGADWSLAVLGFMSAVVLGMLP